MWNLAEIERAEQMLDETQPLHTVTEQGVEMAFCRTHDPDHAMMGVAYRTYRPLGGAPAVPGQLVVLCIHDVHQSGAIYDEAGQALAEHGTSAASLSTGLAWVRALV